MGDSEINWTYVDPGLWKGTITKIEGIGGIVKSENPIVVVKKSLKPGHHYFCKHLTLSILEEYFLKENRYSRSHIPVPLGSFDEGYYYKFVEGSDAFPSEIVDQDTMKPVPIQLDEEDIFSGLFNSFGFNVGGDKVVPNGIAGKNIVHSGWNTGELYKTRRLSSDWKRIDFDYTSCLFNYKKFEEAMEPKKEELIMQLGENYKLALLAAKYYHSLGNLENKEFEEFQELEELVLQFRKEKLKHLATV